MKHFKTKKDSKRIVDNIKFLIMQDNNRSYISPNFLYYYTKMPECLLKNLNIQFNIVNGV